MRYSNELLLQYSRKECLRSLEDSEGRCFHASIELARQAKKIGLGEHVQFIRWRVRDDQKFREHWALSYGTGQSLDMTAVQVDGNPEPLRSLASYPNNFTSKREYPLDVVLHPLERSDVCTDTHFPPLLIWQVHLAMIRYDMNLAIKGVSASRLISAMLRGVEISLLFVAVSLLNRAIRRLTSLLLRL